MTKVQKKEIKLFINLIPTNEIFKLSLIYPSSVIRDLRSQTEICTGVSVNIQQLYYLDKCDLVDESTVQSNDIVSNAFLSLEVWHIWRDLVVAAAQGDNTKVFSMGVTQDSTFSSPSSIILSEKERRLWLQERSNMALLVACHRGHLELSRQLIKTGANVNWSTKLGRTALHLSAAMDKGDIIDLLLHNGADIDIKDNNGYTAMTLANKYGHKSCERHLFMFRWQQRAKNMDYKFLNPPPMAFQLVDSFKKNWKTGPAAQFYIEKLLPAGEYIGSAFNAPKRNWHRRGSDPDLRSGISFKSVEADNESKKVVTFDQWRRQKSAQQRIHEDIKKKKEEAEKSIQEEKQRQRMLKWKAMNVAVDNDGFGATGRRECSEVMLSSIVVPNVDTKTRIKELLLRFGLKDTEEVPKTVYDQWLLHRKNMGKRSSVENVETYDGNLPYQEMIKEFCEKKCHNQLESHDC